MRYAPRVLSRLLSAPRRAKIAAGAAVLVIVGGGAFVALGGVPRFLGPTDSDPLGAVPRDSFLVATANLTELRQSPLYDVLMGKRGEAVLDPRALGLPKLADACGFDPLGRVDRLAVAVPEEGDRGELGVAAKITVTRGELEKCATALAGQHGATTETKRVGSFGVVEDPDGAARPRLAYGHGEMLVAGRGAWFDAMLATADGKQPGIREAAPHASLRASMTGREGWHTPTLLVTALLPRSLRDRIKNEMGAEVGSKDHSQAIMGGVLGVSSAGLALKASANGGSTDAALELVCDAVDACAAVEKLLLKKKFDVSKELTLRMVGLGALLDSIEVKREGARVRVTASAASDSLASTVDRVLRLRASSANAPRNPLPAVSHRPDEIIAAPKPSR